MEELKNALRKELAHLDKAVWMPILQAADTNGDGMIDFGEFKALITKSTTP